MKRIDITTYLPPDKSSLIRGYLFSILTDEPAKVYFNENMPDDVKTAFKCLSLFGKTIKVKNHTALIEGKSYETKEEINCENSATVMHLLMGIALYKNWNLKLTGDSSLMNRDHSDFINAGKLYNSDFVLTELSKESAQLKSFHLLAMLKTGGIIKFKYQTRKNTESLLKVMGAELIEKKTSIEIKPILKLKGYTVNQKADPSSAFIAASLLFILQKPFVIRNLFPEKLRITPFEYLKKAGYNISISFKNDAFEIKSSSKFKKKVEKIDIMSAKVPSIIDEIPFIAYMSARVGIKFNLSDGIWLRNKESDRIKGTVERLGKIFQVVEYKNGFVTGAEKKKFSKKMIHSDDHRMEMLSTLISIDKKIPFTTMPCYNISFPGFLKMINGINK